MDQPSFLPSLIDLDKVIASHDPTASQHEWMEYLARRFLDRSQVPPALLALDPYSAEYRIAAEQFLREITRTDSYTPRENEKSSFLDPAIMDVEKSYRPSIYCYGDSRPLSEFYLAAATIFRLLDVRAGAKVIEYGAGDGQLSLALARLGIDVTAVDVEPRFLELIRRQAVALGVTLKTLEGCFGDSPPGERYDRIIFFEAFHHALDHVALLVQLKEILTSDGFMVLAGEPVIARESPARYAVPFAWGPRLDGLSLYSMKLHGWCELGFRQEYFVERFLRSGWSLEHHSSDISAKADAYVARPLRGMIDLGRCMIDSVQQGSAWHAPEGTHRWTMGSSIIPVPESSAGRSGDLHMHNYLPVKRVVRVDGGTQNVQTVHLAPGESKVLNLHFDGHPIRIASRVDRVSNLLPHSSDDREVGVAISKLVLR
jgi:2-polyprenyl-3-methyl-5-hydroxy-6-metoxy-1,4-benzoquinol methylase